MTVTFAQASYTASEGGTGALVTVRLSAAPEREVVIPLTSAAAGGATGQGEADADYAGVPANLTFGAAETEKTFTVTALDDSIDDDDEGVTLSFGAALPEGVTLGSEATATVSLTDNDNPGVTVTFGAGELYGERGWCGGDGDGESERRAEARSGDPAHGDGDRWCDGPGRVGGGLHGHTVEPHLCRGGDGEDVHGHGGRRQHRRRR